MKRVALALCRSGVGGAGQNARKGFCGPALALCAEKCYRQTRTAVAPLRSHKGTGKSFCFIALLGGTASAQSRSWSCSFWGEESGRDDDGNTVSSASASGSFGGSGVSLISYPQMIYCALRFVPRTTGCWLCRFSFSFHSKIVTQQMEHRNVGTGCWCCSSVGKEAHTHNGGTHSPGICKGTGEDKKLMKQVTSLHSSGLPHSAPFAWRNWPSPCTTMLYTMRCTL